MHTNCWSMSILLASILHLILILSSTPCTTAINEVDEEKADDDAFSVAPLSPIPGGSSKEYKQFITSPEFREVMEEIEYDEEEGSGQTPTVQGKGPYNLEFKDEFTELVKVPSEEWLNQNLLMHNRLRAIHGSLPLDLDYKLCYDAQEWAIELGMKSFKKKEVVLIHNWTNVQGENEGASRKGGRYKLLKLSGTFPVINWYKEIVDHDWDQNVYDWKTRHITQIIWESSKRIGCGRFVTENAKPILIVICRYSPAGNWQDKDAFEEFVHPPLEGDANTVPDFDSIETEVTAVWKMRKELTLTTNSTKKPKLVRKKLTTTTPSSQPETVPSCPPGLDLSPSEESCTWPGKADLQETTSAESSCPRGLDLSPNEKSCTWPGKADLQETTSAESSCPRGLDLSRNEKSCTWPGKQDAEEKTSTESSCPGGLVLSPDGKCTWPGSGNPEKTTSSESTCPQGLDLSSNGKSCTWPGDAISHSDPVKTTKKTNKQKEEGWSQFWG